MNANKPLLLNCQKYCKYFSRFKLTESITWCFYFSLTSRNDPTARRYSNNNIDTDVETIYGRLTAKNISESTSLH